MAKTATRFRVTNAPELAPGVDWVTKSAVGPFIDTGVDLSVGIIDRGRIYLSKDTIREMAEQLGLFNEMQEKAEERYSEGYLDGTRETIGGDIARITSDLGEFVAQLTGYLDGGVKDKPEDRGASEAVLEGGEPLDGESVDESPRPQRKSTGSRSGRRPARVSADTSDGSALRI